MTDKKSKNCECPLGGDETRCEDCGYFPDYKFNPETGDCEINDKKEQTTFVLDKVNTDDEYCYVDITGIGTVVIKKDEEGIVVDIYPVKVVDEPVASTYAFYDELGS